MSRPELGTGLFDRIAQELSDVAQVEGMPRREGRMMSMMLTAKPGAKAPKEKAEKASPHAKEQVREKQEQVREEQEQVREEQVAEPLKVENPEDSGEAG